MKMKKWAIAAVIYLFAVIGGYTAYESFIDKEPANDEASSHNGAVNGENHEPNDTERESEEGHGQKEEEEGHGHGGAVESGSEVNVEIHSEEGSILINVSDLNDEQIDEFEVNHEKLLHLIVVDESLGQYYHLHPEKVGKGEFKLDNSPLTEGSYKAFIDIKPKNLSYQVVPIELKVGNQGEEAHGHTELIADKELSKTIDGETVELNISSFVAGEDVTLSFKLDENKLEQYLGAAGHVVILNETADDYVHVHPLNEQQPIFETQFSKAGKYKIWAEFKLDGKVRIFPFIIEIY
jgi:P-type Cu+ transporter